MLGKSPQVKSTLLVSALLPSFTSSTLVLSEQSSTSSEAKRSQWLNHYDSLFFNCHALGDFHGGFHVGCGTNDFLTFSFVKNEFV